MIQSFKEQGTEDIYDGENTKAARRALPGSLQERARELLDQLEAATQVGDMRLPPSNRLEKLSGDRAGGWSVRINKQYRICFQFESGHVTGVEITDYH
jgi:proteic killer suppression protein